MLNIDNNLTDIDDGRGFAVGTLLADDLEVLRQMVTEQFVQVVQQHAPEVVEDYLNAGIDDYHKVYQPSHFEHGSVWTKQSRIFSAADTDKTLALPSFQAFKEFFVDFLISDEEQLSRPNIYWRLVRPGGSDIGPIHADRWFWDLGHGTMPDGYFRLKIWIPLFAVPGQSGLRVVPESQNSDAYPYHGELRGGMMKPVLDVPENELDVLNLPLSPGQFVLFHDSLLHGGMPNASDKSRVSLEFTFLIRQSS